MSRAQRRAIHAWITDVRNEHEERNSRDEDVVPAISGSSIRHLNTISDLPSQSQARQRCSRCVAQDWTPRRNVGQFGCQCRPQSVSASAQSSPEPASTTDAARKHGMVPGQPNDPASAFEGGRQDSVMQSHGTTYLGIDHYSGSGPRADEHTTSTEDSLLTNARGSDADPSALTSSSSLSRRTPPPGYRRLSARKPVPGRPKRPEIDTFKEVVREGVSPELDSLKEVYEGPAWSPHSIAPNVPERISQPDTAMPIHLQYPISPTAAQDSKQVVPAKPLQPLRQTSEPRSYVEMIRLRNRSRPLSGHREPTSKDPADPIHRSRAVSQPLMRSPNAQDPSTSALPSLHTNVSRQAAPFEPHSPGSYFQLLDGTKAATVASSYRFEPVPGPSSSTQAATPAQICQSPKQQSSSATQPGRLQQRPSDPRSGSETSLPLLTKTQSGGDYTRSPPHLRQERSSSIGTTTSSQQSPRREDFSATPSLQQLRPEAPTIPLDEAGASHLARIRKKNRARLDAIGTSAKANT